MAGPQADIEAIVREVLRRLQEQPGAAPTAAPAVPGQLCLQQRLVTLASVAGRLDGVRQVIVGSQTIVTPAVRDELKKRGIALTIADHTLAAPANEQQVLVGVVAEADSSGATLAAIRAEARGAERIGNECVIALTRQLAQTLAERGGVGLVLTRQPSAALCLANRHAGLRAAWGVSPAAVREALQTVGANLLVIDPERHSLYEVRGMVREFLAGNHQCPKAYRKALGGGITEAAGATPA